MLLKKTFTEKFSLSLQLFKTTWQNIFVYRFNFFMWRVRSVVHRLALYFFWWAVYQYNQQIGAYDQAQMLTYILLASILRTVVTSSKSPQVGADISTGSLSQHLLKPFDYFQYIFCKDLADKAANIFFLVLEMTAFFIVLQPPFLLPKSLFHLVGFLIVLGLALLLYFYTSMLISLLTFWYPEHNGWPMRFLFNVCFGFFAGELIPLDVLPSVFSFIRYLPPAYFIYFPLQVYFGKLSAGQLLLKGLVSVFWIYLLSRFARYLWKKGLKNYTAAGI